MSYDPDSAEAKKGVLGEEIVKKYLEDLGAIVMRPDEYGEKTLVDFLAVPKDGSAFVARYVEVKVRSAFPYAHGQYLCYAFPAVQIDAYKKFAADKTLPVQLWIVDPSVGKIFISNLSSEKNSLEHKQYIDCKEFPFDQETKIGLMRFYHQNQFWGGYDISKKDLERLCAIGSNKPIISDAEAAALWYSIDYGTGLDVEWLTREALVALKELKDEFGSNKVLCAIGYFCNEHYDDFCGAVQGEGDCPLDDVIKTLRKTITAEQSFADKNLFVKVDDILTAPNGINIEIITVAGDSRFFVKATRVSSAIGYQNPSITASAPIIKAADRLQVKYYRFPTQRLSGGDSYGSKAYYFAVEDVPKVLVQYCELHYKAKPATRQGRYNLAAQKLREWFQSTVLPKYASANQKITCHFKRR